MPFHPETAVREARRYEAALALLTNPDYEILPDPNFDGIFTVFKQGAPTYGVQVVEGHHCTCPDFEKHGDFCKHLLCAIHLREEEKRCEAYEAEEALRESAESLINGTEPLRY